jgi:hypothetical protein
MDSATNHQLCHTSPKASPGTEHQTLLVGWTSGSFGHVARIPGVDGSPTTCFSVQDYLGNTLHVARFWTELLPSFEQDFALEDAIGLHSC